ncbi:MAG: hypothetical protein ACYDBS_07875 [Acidimicrobiales bacterium]
MSDLESRSREAFRRAAAYAAFDLTVSEVMTAPRRRRGQGRVKVVVVCSSLAIATIAVVLVGVALSGGRSHLGGRTTKAVSSTAVPWVNDPASPPSPPGTVPQKPLPTGAPPCTASELSVTRGMGSPPTQDNGFFLRVRNIGRSACMLRGRPRVVASEPGKPTVSASAGDLPSFFGEVANTPPGGTVMALVYIPAICQADPTGGNQGLPIYHSVMVSYATGGSKRIGGLHVSFPCGMATTPFYTPRPQPEYLPDPLAVLVPHLRLPSTVMPGTTLIYQVDLENPTSRRVGLSPCPSYLEHSSIPTKFEYRLNCSKVHAIPAHGHVTYEMEMAIPATAQPGEAEVLWSLIGFSTRTGRGQVQVR